MRRLMRCEHNYAMRLTCVDTIAADATRLFPADANAHGFPNYGPVQALSDVQPEHYTVLPALILIAFFGEKQTGTKSSSSNPKT